MKIAFARQYLDFAVYNYPFQKVLSAIAYNRYKALGVNVPLPLLGGKLMELTARIFGWKVSRFIRYCLKEKNKKHENIVTNGSGNSSASKTLRWH